MSKHEALQFLQRVKTDEDIVEKLRVLEAEEGAGEEASIASVAASFGSPLPRTSYRKPPTN